MAGWPAVALPGIVPPMECYACSNEAGRQCRRCARVYCEIHGGDLCAECLSPASSMPSFNLYRGSLLALLIGTAVAIWLLVRPPGGDGEAQVFISEVTPTSIVTAVLDTPPPASPSPQVTRTPGARATSTPAPTATPEVREYTVQSGDTLLGIAELFAPAGVETLDFAQQIADLNGFATLSDAIVTGRVLAIP